MFQKSHLTAFDIFSITGALPVQGSLALRAWLHPRKKLFTFLNDQGEESDDVTYLDLWQRARGIADHLAARYPAGERIILFFPQGLDFIAAFLGCLMSGHIAVPSPLPSRRRVDRCVKMISDSDARCALAPTKVIDTAPLCFQDTLAADLDWIPIEDIPSASRLPGTSDCGRDEDPERIAFLQYTSGSTADPRGVMVTQRNITINLRLMRDSWELDADSNMVFWQPHHHDMGLIMGQLLPILLGNHSVLMGPNTVVRQPLVWLRAISDYRAAMAGGPNFIFDVAVERYVEEKMTGIDLSCWKVAPNGADVVRATTIDRFTNLFAKHGFRPETFVPCYGLAEATLVVSGGPTRRLPRRTSVDAEELRIRRRVLPPESAQQARELVGCGEPAYPFEIAIVEPETLNRLAAGKVGEIWLAGPSVTAGYWKNPAATERTFHARISGEAEKNYLRTGDLGFIHGTDLQLYICGRLKDMIVWDGRSLHPEDIEHSIIESAGILKNQSCAVFGYHDELQRQRIVSMIEIDRSLKRRPADELRDLKNRIRLSVTEEHGVPLSEIVFIPPNSLRKTTSGKIQRGVMRQLFLSQEFEVLEP